MIRLRILSGHRAGTEREVAEFPFIIGRARADHFRFDEAGVWDRHLTLTYEKEEGFFISRNPQSTAMLNGQPLERERLKAGDELAFGSVRLRFSLGDPEQRDLKNRERLGWALIAAVAIAQIALLVWLA